ncbi:MAG TPA: acid phosphatase [Acidimicrobiia bacterium]|nr:acid phosphatase [Acidimicrobiia bacterium]
MPRRMGIAALASLIVIAAALVAVAPAGADNGNHNGQVDPHLRGIDHLVVIYEENHSFDNLYGLWPGVDGIASPASATANQTQVDQGGAPYDCLKQNDPNLTSPPLAATCTDPRGFTSAFTNQVFGIDNHVAQNQKTEDLVHRYYQEQYQIDGGKMDRFTTGSDAVGLTQGYYKTTNLPVYRYLTAAGAPPSMVADHFFHASFGGSFLNHQWLVAAQTPTFAGALNDGSANDLHSVVDANGMPTSSPLYASPLGSKTKDKALTASCTPPAGAPANPPGVVCGDYAVNTIQPASQPFSPSSAPAQRLPLLSSSNIGDELSAKDVSWGWYSGGWDNAAGVTTGAGWTNGTTPGVCSDANHNPADVYPYCGDKLFQYHHQPFNYFANYAEGAPGRSHLQDEQDFLQQAAGGTLPAVSFIKPLGPENEHPGYTDVTSGDQHLVDLVKAIQGGPDWEHTAIVVTYDEHGGFWDHVPPPTAHGVSDQWGPGARVPALVISPLLQKSGVDHTQYDTTSILATIENRWQLPPLGSRDASVHDLSGEFHPAH